MAKLVQRNFDINVETIADRNAIPVKKHGMVVTVSDATADIKVGSGRAIYRYDSTGATDELKWVLVAKDEIDAVVFREDSRIISGDIITLAEVPLNGVLFDLRIFAPDNTFLEVTYSIADNIVTLDVDTPNEFNGYTATFSYSTKTGAGATFAGSIGQHTHSNQGILAKISEDSGKFAYDNKKIARYVNNVGVDINKDSHGLTVGQFVKADMTLSKADLLTNAEAIGIVSDVIDLNNFVLTFSGYCSMPSLIGDDGDALFIQDDGTLAATTGAIIKQIGVRVKNTFLDGIVVGINAGLEITSCSCECTFEHNRRRYRFFASF